MDDFGSGYSSLTSLNELPFSTLKIDKKLIDYIEQDEMIKTTRKLDNFMDWELLNKNKFYRIQKIIGAEKNEQN